MEECGCEGEPQAGLQADEGTRTLRRIEGSFAGE
jgi:hypothetical protein